MRALSSVACALGTGILALFLSGCGSDDTPLPLDPLPMDPLPMDPRPADPLRPSVGNASGLTDVSSDLEALLERGQLPGACAKMQPGDRASRLLCGKAMFFYESFGTSGVPSSLTHFLLDNFAAEVGPGFEKFGMVADPSSPKHLPLGMAPTAKLGGKVDSLAFTCASCHFGRLPDGRYAVGAPNHRYEYGKHILALAVFPMVALSGPKDREASVLAALKPLLDHYQADASLKGKLLLALLPLLGSGMGAPMFGNEAEAKYAAWSSGTMDFLIEPLPVNDKVHTISKIPALWEIPDPTEVKANGLPNAMLSWTGGTTSVMEFCEGFVTFGGGIQADWPTEKLAPLVEYIHSLRRPQNPSPPESTLVDTGRRLFAQRGCQSCHDGPRGSGKRVYTFDEIATDRAMQRWMDPDLSGTVCCGLPADTKLTYGIKSPRLVGLWAASRFLHNGAVDTLENLFCLDRARPSRSDEPYGDQGHMQTCDSLSSDEKRALIAYLRAN